MFYLLNWVVQPSGSFLCWLVSLRSVINSTSDPFRRVLKEAVLVDKCRIKPIGDTQYY